MWKRVLLGMVLATLLCFSCSLSPEQEIQARLLELPDLKLENATYVLSRTDAEPIQVRAAEIALYEQTNKAFLKQVSFTQYDADKQLVLQGYADQAEVDLSSYDTQLNKSIRVEKPLENLVIEAESLTWLHEQETLVSIGDSVVSLSYEGDKKITGTGLRAELFKGTVSFSQVIEGVIIQ